MKENEASEKLYIDFRDRVESTWRCAYTKKTTANDIEYTRTDAIIEKVYKFFAPYIQDNSGGYDRAYIYEKFKKYMKEE